MRKLKAEGLFQKVGVSARAEDSPVALARKFQPDVMQLPASLLDQRLVLRGDLSALADLGVEVQLRSIFMQGLLFLPRDGLPTALASAGPRLSRIRRQIAEAGADPLQAALAYALQIPQVSSIVVGVASSAELRAIVAAALAPPPRLDWSELALDESTAGGVGLWAAA
jgi:aryl-alcohol dehydrogenase-like predicted oxidoreductase